MSLKTNILKNPAPRWACAGVAAVVAAALLGGCANTKAADAASHGTHETVPKDAVRVSEAWIKAAPNGMTSGFAQVHNATDQDKALVSVSSPLAMSVELHEMAGTGTSMGMQKLEGPLALPANSTVALEPGAKHLMLMGLKQELKAGSTATLLFTYADRSTDEIDFEIKEFGGAKESYAPEAGHDEHAEH